MKTELRKTGIKLVGHIPWGTHFCHFYETKDDLLDILIPYFKTGWENNEFCIWVVSNSDLITVEEAKAALEQAVPDLGHHLSAENIEILNGLEWYLEEDIFNFESVIAAWDAKLQHALDRGFAGMRVSSDTFWLAEKDRKDFFAYEKQLNESIADKPMTVLCTYPLEKCGAAEVFGVLHVHHFALANRQGEWDVIQSPEPIQAQAEIKRLNEELNRVPDRKPEPPAILRYGVAILAVTAALIINRLLNIHLVGAPAMLFLCALMFSAWYGGVKPSLVAMPLAVLAFGYYFVTPNNSWSVDPREIPRLLLFVMSSLFVISLSGAQRRASGSLGHARDVLAGAVEELKRTNLALRTENSERKQAEEALAKSEDHLRLVLDTTPALIHTGRPDGYLDYFNQRWLKYVGRPLEELRDWGWTTNIHPDDREGIVNEWRASLASGELFQYEARVRRSDGEYRWMLHRKVALRDEHGNIVKWYGSSIDIEDRKQTEEKLLQSERQLAEAQRIARIGSWNWDIKNNVVTWSDEVYRIFGIKPREFGPTLEAYFELVHPEDRDFVINVAKSSFGKGEPFSYYYRIIRPDGEMRILHSHRNVFTDERGNLIRSSGTLQDVTERRQAEESLRLFRTLLDQSSDAIEVIDPDTLRFLDCNKSAYQELGYSREEFLSLTVYDIDPLIDEADGAWLIQEMERSGSVIFESTHRRKDGSSFPVEVSLKIVRLERDYRLAVVRDITERKKAEEISQKGEDRLRLVTDTIPTMAWSLRDDGLVDFVNRRWRDYTGVGLKELNEDPTGVMHPDDISPAVEKWLAAKATGEAYEEELRLRRADGEYRWFLVRTDPMRDEDGNIVKWFGISIDIEDRKLAEDRVKATSEQLRALSARLESAREEEGRRIAREIHDELGATLSSLRWDLEGLDESISETGDESKLAEMAEKIQGMMRLTDTIIQTVRRIASELRPIALDALGLTEAIELQATQFQARTGIVVDCYCNLENIDLSREQSTAIFRIFQEALTNVLRHAQATRIEIRMSKEMGNFILTISDNGRGINNDEKSGALALGILGMRERANLAGGEIEISAIEGNGTLVTVRIPASS